VTTPRPDCPEPLDPQVVAARASIVEDLLLRGVCRRDEAEAEAARLLPARVPSTDAPDAGAPTG
jgi:hypothetical protein